MQSRVLTYVAATILFATLAAPVRFAAQDQEKRTKPAHYRVLNLGTLGGTSSSGNTINNLGWALGGANLPGDATQHATLWIEGLKLDLGTLGGPNSDIVWPNMNDRGEIVGISETSDVDPLGEAFSCPAVFNNPSGHSCIGFVWQNGTMTALPTLGGNNAIAAAVNNRGQAVGWAENTVHDPTCVAPQVLQFKAVIWGPKKGQIEQLAPLPGDPDSAATGINDQGQVVGISGTCENAIGAYSAKHAVLWQDGNPIDIGTLGGAGWNTPMAINNRGQVAGFANLPGDVVNGRLHLNFHAFLWTKARGMQDLKTLPGDAISEATAINDEGQVLGVSFRAGFAHPRAFLWQDGVMTDLNTLIPSDSNLYLISTGGINNRGEITGQACVLINGACLSTSDTPAFLAIPTFGEPEAAEEAGSNEAPKIDLPENIRKQLLQQRGFGRIGTNMNR
jgi:probable HAF family extracellular repeat protein